MFVEFGLKRPRMREVVRSYTITCWAANFVGWLSALLASHSNSCPMHLEPSPIAQLKN